MEKTIEIDGRPVTFRATAAIPRLYRLRFHRDIMQDMAFMRKEILKAQKEKKSVPVDILTVFENVAFLMAKHADPSMEAYCGGMAGDLQLLQHLHGIPCDF